MHRALLAAAVVAATITAGPAVATPPAIVGTTCGFVAAAALSGDVYTGVIFTADAGVDVTEPFENPVTVSALCELQVNGVTKDTMSRDFPIVAGGVEDTSFLLNDADTARICTTLSAVDTDGEVNNRPRVCHEATVTDVPQDELCPFLPPIVCTDPALVRVAFVVPGLSI